MINEEELRISNKSYINKDFASVYPELVELVQILTNKYDPEASLESDVGVVILKIVAFIADKLNYNIDKNVLEDFIGSCTQVSSMRKLCEMLGYFMNYYNAPMTDITVTYTGSMEGKQPITLNALSTVFTSSEEDSNVSFILTENITIQEPNDIVSKPAIQGKLRELQVNTSAMYSSNSDTGNNLVQLDNLDDNNRIYFPEVNVAQNGVFILDDTSTTKFWTRVENLNYQKADERCFKFGFDSTRGLPYIEFPKDIANLIGNGLYIRYVVTDGLNGNVKANVINKLDSGYDWEAAGYDEGAEESLFVRNYSATLNGSDPETINEAYNGFKKTVGTFNTLTTCIDYANAIYNMLGADGVYPLVSNVQVSDRRDDINYSKRVVSYDNLGDVILNKTSAANLNAYQLCAYPLAPITSYTDTKAYKDSFSPLTKTSSTVTSAILNALELNKTISHDFKELASTDTYAFKNKLTLNGKLTTTYKVNANEVVDIDLNVIYQLVKDFNARNVDYGYEIPYDSLVDSIQSADKRINYVSLMEPTLTTYVMVPSGDEFKLVSAQGKDAYINLLAKNILNGNIALYDYDTRFKYELGHTKIDDVSMVNENIAKIETELALTLPNRENVTLLRNEAVQLVAPNLVSEITYPAYCFFRFESGVHLDKNTNPVPANTIYKLGANERLIFCWTQNDIQYTKEYTGTNGDIIKANFALYNTPNDNEHFSQYDRSVIKKTTTLYGDMWFYSLGAREQIEILKVNIVNLAKKTNCYWLRNNINNAIFTNDDIIYVAVAPGVVDEDNVTNYYVYSSGSYIPATTYVEGTTYYQRMLETILQENEYFFYTDASATQLISLGSGTTLRTGLLSLLNKTVDVVSIEDVFERGMIALKDLWQVIDFSGTDNAMIVQENNILTLTEKDSIKLSGDIEGGEIFPGMTLSNALVDVPSTVKDIYYTINGQQEAKLDMYQVEGAGWKIRSRLHINVTKDESQAINEGLTGSGVRQTVNFYNSSSLSTPAVTLNASGQYFNLNTDLQFEGGSIDVSVKVKDELSYPVAAYCYTIQSGKELPQRNMDDYVKYTLKSTPNPSTVFDYNVPIVTTGATNEKAIVMFHYNKTGGSGAVTLVPTNCSIKLCYGTATATTDPMALAEGINVFEITKGDSGTPSIAVTNAGNTGVLTMGSLDFIKGYNSALKLQEFHDAVPSIAVAALQADLDDAIRDSDFYYNCKIDNSKAITSDDMLSPYALYDANNRANKFTISQIDFDTIDVDVIRSSKL